MDGIHFEDTENTVVEIWKDLGSTMDCVSFLVVGN